MIQTCTFEHSMEKLISRVLYSLTYPGSGPRRLLCQWKHNGLVSVHCDGCESKNRHIYAHGLKEGAEGAHEVGQIPSLQ